MLEESTSRNGLVAFFEDFISLIKAFPTVALTWGGSAPLWVFCFYNGFGVASLFAIQAYFLTMYLLLENPLRNGKKDLHKWWFWKATLCSIPIHVLILVGLFYWDRKFPVGAGYYAFKNRSLEAGGLDIIILGFIFDLFRPGRMATTTASNPYFRERAIFPPQKRSGSDAPEDA